MEEATESLWAAQSVNEDQQIRNPRTSTTELGKGSTNEKINKEPSVQSKLNVNASEWFPPNYDKKEKKLTGVKQNANQPTKSEPINCDFIDSPDDIRLKHLVTTLTKDPGQFSDLFDLFMDTLFPYFEDIVVLSRAAQLLVNQAIAYPSFRYTAARLSCFIEQNCAPFTSELHLICKRELEQNSNKSGLILFVAELYTQLNHENIYGGYLVDAFKHLLDIGGDDNIKSVCQALKLTGNSLEENNKKALEDVITKLIAIKPKVCGTALNLIDTVINLKSSKWGMGNPPEPTNQDIDREPVFWDDLQNTVFYNVDGTQFTNEENAFLAANVYAAEEYLTDISDPDELCDPEPEMDEEIRAAFKDFVKFSKR